MRTIGEDDNANVTLMMVDRDLGYLMEYLEFDNPEDLQKARNLVTVMRDYVVEARES